MLDLFKALADVNRLRLLAVLLKGEFTVQELTRIFSMGQSRISHHLKIMTEAGLLTVKRQGTWSYYRACRENRIFAAILPVIEPELESLPERSFDLASVTALLEERRRRSQEFFDRYALQWDDLARGLLPVPDYLQQFLSMVPDGKVLLEIGVGTGRLLTDLVSKGIKVIGVDHSPAMLEEAKRRLAAAGVKGVELRLGEMSHLPLPDGSVDCAVLNMVLHHAADPQSVLVEISRVLTGGGLLLIADLARHERESARERLADQWLGFDESELAGWLSRAGFKRTGFHRIPAAVGQESVILVEAT